MQQTTSPQGDNSDRNLQWKDRSLPYKISFAGFCLCSLLYIVAGFALPLWSHVQRHRPSTTESLTVSDSTRPNSTWHQQSLVLGLWQKCTADFTNCSAINVKEVGYSCFMAVRVLSVLAVLLTVSVWVSVLFGACCCCVCRRFQQKVHYCGFGALLLTMLSIFIFYSKLPSFFPQYGSDKITLYYSFCIIVFNLVPMGFSLTVMAICKEPIGELGASISTPHFARTRVHPSPVAVQLPVEDRAGSSGEVNLDEFLNRVWSVAPPSYERVMRERGGTLSSPDPPSYEDVENNLELFCVKTVP